MFRIVLLTALLAVSAASAQITEEEALERFFTEEIQAEWFAPSFLAKVPVERIAPLLEQLTGSLGAFQGLQQDGSRWLALYEKGRVPALVTLDAEGRFSGLRLLPPMPNAADLAGVQEAFDALPGDGHLLVRVDGENRLAHAADTPFAVGSAFKLVILKTLKDEIEAGERRWDDVVTFAEIDRGLSTGTMGHWPDGAPLTLHTAATLMIAQSDNEATDLLLRVLGREAVEARDPSGRNRPFLSTVEAFKLKDPENATLLAQWRDGDEAARRDVVLELSLIEDLPSTSLFAGDPVATDVEWFFTATELCDLVASVADLDLFRVNPGVVDRDAYDRVAYKGGSEPGVLNMTTWVRDRADREICVCATKNADGAIETSDMAGVVSAAFEVLEGER